MTDHEKRIREALEAGPTEGVWHWHGDPVKGDPTGRVRFEVVTSGKTITRIYYSSYEGGPTNAGQDAAFIAACNPSAIRALLADLDAARAALSEAKAGGWVSPYDSVPQPDQTVLVWSRQTWETAPSLKIDTWAMQREAPLSFSSATIEVGYGWDDHEDFESVIAWQPLPAPPAQKDPT